MLVGKPRWEMTGDVAVEGEAGSDSGDVYMGVLPMKYTLTCIYHVHKCYVICKSINTCILYLKSSKYTFKFSIYIILRNRTMTRAHPNRQPSRSGGRLKAEDGAGALKGGAIH